MVGIHSRMTPVIFTKRHSLNLPQPFQEATCVDSQELLTPSQLWPLATPCSSSVVAGEIIMKCTTFCNTAWHRRSPRPLREPKPLISKKIPSQSQIKPDVHYLNRLSHLKRYFKKGRGCSNANQYQQKSMRCYGGRFRPLEAYLTDYISKNIRTSRFHHQIFLSGDLISQWFSFTWAMPVILPLERQGGQAATQSLLQAPMGYRAPWLKS